MEDDDGHKEVGRARRWHQSKNLVAERKRRKKLNDRLYLLLSLVPKISKVQVEVSQVNGNEFFLKAFWEQKPARFVRLVEAINSLGLEVTNAHVITFRGLVLNDFKVKKRENEVVHADQARDSLLELIFNPNGGRSKSGCIGENGGSDHHHHHHYHHH